MRVCILYACIGALVGAFSGFAFVTITSPVKRMSVPAIVTPITIGFLISLKNYVSGVSIAEYDFIIPSVCYMIALLGLFLFTCIFICYLIRTQTDKVKIRVLDIVLGYSKSLELYYDSRRQEIERNLNYEDLMKLKTSLEAKEIRLDSMSRQLKEQIDGGVYLILPIEQPYFFTNRFVELLPVHIDNYCKFYHEMRKTTKTFLDNWSNEQNPVDFLGAYFVAICMHINRVLFDTSSDIVRSHVRIRKSNYYVKYISVIGGKQIEKDMTRIPIDDGLIYHSGKNRTSMVKSLNLELHHKAHNDSTWKDYISFALQDYAEDSIPALSFGVSIKNEQMHGAVLILMNMLKVEDLIAEHMERINNVCNIMDTINKISEGMPDESSIEV